MMETLALGLTLIITGLGLPEQSRERMDNLRAGIKSVEVALEYCPTIKGDLRYAALQAIEDARDALLTLPSLPTMPDYAHLAMGDAAIA